MKKSLNQFKVWQNCLGTHSSNIVQLGRLPKQNGKMWYFFFKTTANVGKISTFHQVFLDEIVVATYNIFYKNKCQFLLKFIRDHKEGFELLEKCLLVYF